MVDVGGNSSRKVSSTQDPLNKGVGPTERVNDSINYVEGNEGDGRKGHDSDDDSVGSDLYKDDDDRESLAKLSELQREMILADRACILTDKILRVTKGKVSSPRTNCREALNELYEGEDDRQRLAQKTELERSMILADRTLRLNDNICRKRKARYPDIHSPGHEEVDSDDCDGDDNCVGDDLNNG